MLSIESSHQRTRKGKWNCFLVGCVIFGVLWILYIPCREIYFPDGRSIPLLTDGLLLAPDARWQDWFTRGYSHFWDLYPDWPTHTWEATATDFSRPAFQFLLYLAHFLLGRDWGSYQLINAFAVAGMGASAFQIAQAALGLRTGPSLVAAMLVVLSPPVLESWLLGIGFAIEPLATVLVAAAFLAVLARRDFPCLALLFLALLTKENTVWAPFAASLTIMMRPKLNESFFRRTLIAAAMLLPMGVWLWMRFAFFGGIGGTYATAAGYTPFFDFVKLTVLKFTHLHYLFVLQTPPLKNRPPILFVLDRTTLLIFYGLLLLWPLRILPEAIAGLRHFLQTGRLPIVGSDLLVALWAAIALAFLFLLPLYQVRYATYVVVFAWPALLSVFDRFPRLSVQLGVAFLCIASFGQGSWRLLAWIGNPAGDYFACRNDYKSINAALSQVPADIRQVYLISARNVEHVNPKSLRLILGLSPEIIRIGEIHWNCRTVNDSVIFDHSSAGGIISLKVTLPACASFFSYTERFKDAITNGRLYRSETISYVLPEMRPNTGTSWEQGFGIGRRMIVLVRPNGAARFLIEHGAPDGFAWFDSP